eukprot:scaffold47973_cov76-Cyclotella_meneghiniana.AAC.1
MTPREDMSRIELATLRLPPRQAWRKGRFPSESTVQEQRWENLQGPRSPAKYLTIFKSSPNLQAYSVVECILGSQPTTGTMGFSHQFDGT